MSTLIQELEQRGFIAACTDMDGITSVLNAGDTLTVYAGFDCTADSLHVGNLMSLMMLRIFRRHGHNVIPLIGTATTRIGDPSGKDAARPLLDDDTIQANCRGITKSVATVLGLRPGAEGDNNWVVFNSDWTLDLNLVDFLRDVGRKISVNKMLALESVRRRQENEEGISFLEFTYSLFQANDFLQLHRNHGVNVQIGGSDQWGNLTMGTELIRKSVPDAKVFGITHPLLTNSKGEKMGKSVNGAVWLNTERLSDFDFWQFWRNVDDTDVVKLLKVFTDIPVDEIERMAGTEHINTLKGVLADHVTAIVRGDEASKAARAMAEAAFGSGSIDDIPVMVVNSTNLPDILVELGCVETKSEGRRAVTQGAVRIDGDPVSDLSIDTGGVVRLTFAKKKHFRIRIVLEARLRKFLGNTGIEFFRKMSEEFGTVSPVLPIMHDLNPMKSFAPHPVHLREGMQVRNWLRSQPECSEWSDHDYDDRWANMVKSVI